jgi:hypothetical protein
MNSSRINQEFGPYLNWLPGDDCNIDWRNLQNCGSVWSPKSMMENPIKMEKAKHNLWRNLFLAEAFLCFVFLSRVTGLGFIVLQLVAFTMVLIYLSRAIFLLVCRPLERRLTHFVAAAFGLILAVPIGYMLLWALLVIVTGSFPSQG